MGPSVGESGIPLPTFSTWSERQAHGVRWVLLIGWLGLIGSLLGPHPVPVGDHGPAFGCSPATACALHDNDGNRIFWGAVVPLALLVIVGLSHEVWRRICPLAFLSQLPRALGWQRTAPGRGGRREPVRVTPKSWLGRHHVQLQWGLFIAGLCLRLLVVNSSPLGLGLFLLTTLAAALLVGWAFDGKAWCHYVCPMGPVQTVLTGPRSLLGSPAHLETGSRLTQSMCRTHGDSGTLQSACVACQTPCLDIDAERAYWQTLRGKRGLTWAWTSYPGLILAFFLLIQWQGGGDVDYLRSGRWAYDTTVVQRIWTPLSSWSSAVTAPLLQPLRPAAPKASAPPPRAPAPPVASARQAETAVTPRRRAQPIRPASPRPSPAASRPVREQPSVDRRRPALPASLTHFTTRPTEVYLSGQQLPTMSPSFLGGSRKPGS